MKEGCTAEREREVALLDESEIDDGCAASSLEMAAVHF